MAQRLLIVDDEPDLLLLLQVQLTAEGFQTALAADGDVALQRLRQDRFDLVLLDIQMPVLDGWGVLEALGQDADPPAVVILSAWPNSDNKARAMALGAADFVDKPYQPEDLVNRIRKAIASGPRPGAGAAMSPGPAPTRERP